MEVIEDVSPDFPEMEVDPDLPVVDGDPDQPVTSTITLSNDKASMVLSDLLSVVQDEAQTDALSNVQISFTCKICKSAKSSLRDLMDHLSSGCAPKSTKKRGRPPKVKQEQDNDAEYKPVVETAVPVDTGRNTRLKSGAMKRKSVLELFSVKEEVDDKPVKSTKVIRDEETSMETVEPQETADQPQNNDQTQEEDAETEEFLDPVAFEPKRINENPHDAVITVVPVETTKVVEDGDVNELQTLYNLAVEELGDEARQVGTIEDIDVPKSTPGRKKGIVVAPKFKREWTKTKKHKCSKCISRAFPSERELDIHMLCHSNPDKNAMDHFKCPSCDYGHRLWARMLLHLITHVEYMEVFNQSHTLLNIVGDFPCPVCKKMYDRKSNMIQHMYQVHQRKRRQCQHCSEILTVDDKKFQRHLDKCSNMQWKCEHCDYTTKVKSNFMLHKKIHDGTGHECEVCQAVFPTKQRLRAHSLTHREDRPRFVCDTCGNDFASMDAVKKHVARFHSGVQGRDWQCDMCSYKGLLEYDLKKHIQQVHHKKYKCQHCSFSTNAEATYKQHMEYHSPDKIHKCPYTPCYFSAATSQALGDHLTYAHNIHFKNQCPLCLKHFKKKTSLLRHLITHTNSQPYQCNECGEKFYSHTTYYRHRHKTGHDKKRDGIASVPQNITIRYTQESDMAVTVASSVHDVDGTVQQAKEEVELATQIQKNALVQVSADPPPLQASDIKVEAKTVNLIPESEYNQQLIEVPIVDSQGVSQTVNVLADGLDIAHELLEEETVQDESQVFVVHMEEDGVTKEVVMTHKEMIEHLGGQQLIVHEQDTLADNTTEEYAVVMVPDNEESMPEPEAALSMLQLHQSQS